MRVLLIIALTLTIFSCQSKKQKQHNVSAIETCQDIFYSVPNSFEEFVEMYGYSEEHGEGTLSHKPQNISIAFHCPEVSTDLKVKKAINIAVGGNWDADGVAMFQEQLRRLVMENQELSNVFIKSLSEEEELFWVFFFDEPHPNNPTVTQLFNDLQTSTIFSQTQKELMNKTRSRILTESDHGH